MIKSKIIKIGEVVRQQDSKWIIMIVEEDDENKHYLSELKKFVEDKLPNYSILNTKGIIKSSGFSEYRHRSLNKPPENKHIVGIPDGLPEIGKGFSIDNGYWKTSIVENIIYDDIILTKNSVYAIDNISVIRKQKLKDLGL